MKWLRKTHGVFFELVRHFLARMFDSEWFAARGQWRTVAVSALALALPAGLVLLDPPYLSPGRAPLSAEALGVVALADDLALMTLMFAITGLLGVMQWETLFPSRRDHFALAGLPVRPRQIFAARFAAVSLFSLAAVAALNLLPSFLAPHQFTGRAATNPPAYLVAAGLGCLTLLFAMVALQGLLLNLLPGRAFQVACSYVQGALVGLLLLAGLASWFVADWRQDAMARLTAFSWAPPVWFTGLHQALLGSRDPFQLAMAVRALLAAAIAPAAAALLYAISFRRYRRLLLEAPYETAVRVRRWSLLRLLGGDPRTEAILHFMAKTLARSRSHRMILLAYLGAAFGIMINALLLAGFVKAQGRLQFIVLYWPLGISMILLAGVRHMFSLPSDLRANWLFQSTESLGRRQWMTAVERFVTGFAILPLHLLFLAPAVAVLGWQIALRMTLLHLLVSLAAFEFLFYSWQQLPFACSYAPGKRPLVALLASWMAVLCVLVPVLSIMIAAASQFAELFLVYFVLFSGVWIWARRRRREGWGEARLAYEDLPDAMPDLGIREAGPAVSMLFETASGPEVPAVEAAPLPGWILRLRALVKRRQLDRDLEDELAFHVAMRQQSLASDGLAPAAAQLAARRQFGNTTSIAESLRDLWTFTWIESLVQDLRYGVRQLRRSPAFTLIAVATLALGIGGTATIFSMFDIVVWRPLPLPHLESLVMVLQKVPGDSHSWNRSSMADVEDIRRSAPSLASLASWSDGMVSLMDADGSPVRVEAVRATANFFDVLGMRPALGRTFQTGEDQPGHDTEVVLSDTCWRTRFAADPDLVGRPIRVNGVSHTVIGVMPPDFGFPRVSRELWIPLALTLEQAHSRNAQLVASIGRLKPGKTMANVGAELDGIAARLEKSYPETNVGRRFMAWTVPQFNGGAVLIVYSTLLLGSAVIALLIACVNIASLQLSRGAARFREVAVRMSLGAGRRRIVRQLATENMVLAVAGAAGGLVVAAWGLKLVKYGVPAEMRHYMPAWSEIGLNVRTLLFASAVALLSAMTAGLAPALGGSRPNLTEALKEGGRGASAGRGGHRLRNLLVAAEIALATVLVSGAGLMVRSFQAGLERGTQLEPKTLLTVRVALDDQRYREPRQLTAFYREALQRIAALPGARSAAAVTHVPYGRGWRAAAYAVEGYEPRRGEHLTANLQAVTPSYFATVRIPLLAGRMLDDRDNANSTGAVLMSRQLSERWRIGQRIRLGDAAQWFTIVGVVDNVLNSVLDTAPQPTLYVPLAQAPDREMDLVVRTAGDARTLGAAVRTVMRGVDPEVPVSNLNPLTTLIRQDSFGFAYIAALMGIFGLLALALAALGVYGMMACLVTEQTHDLGIRMAIGAPRGAVLRMLFTRGMRVALAGFGLGLLPALALARALRSLLFFVTAAPPVMLLVPPLVLLAAAVLAIYLPARRVLRIDPVIALRVG
jgi:putative ABC transport system permease protein